ncbi:hypothetical protein [Prevotella sp.]
MRIYVLSDAVSVAVRCGERSDGIRIQQKPCPLGIPSSLLPFGQ